MKQNTIKLVFGCLIIASGVIGIILNIIHSGSLTSALNLLNYYTIQSNIIVIIILSLSVFGKGRNQVHVWLGAATIWILMTGLIYHFFLFGLHAPQGINLMASILLHYVVPIGMCIYYLFIAKKPEKRISWPLRIASWGIYPLIYASVSLLRGQLTGFYPYWFLNPEKAYPDGIGSYGYLLLFVVISYLIFIIIGLLMELMKHAVTLKAGTKTTS